MKANMGETILEIALWGIGIYVVCASLFVFYKVYTIGKPLKREVNIEIQKLKDSKALFEKNTSKLGMKYDFNAFDEINPEKLEFRKKNILASLDFTESTSSLEKEKIKKKFEETILLYKSIERSIEKIENINQKLRDLPKMSGFFGD